LKLTSPEHLQTAGLLAKKLHALNVDAHVLDEVSEGPVVSVYRLLPVNRTRVSQLEALASDFAVALGVEDVVVKRLVGEASVSLFIPNKNRKYVTFRDVSAELWKVKDSMAVPISLGIAHDGSFVVEDLATLPHLLIAGSTGGGKSTLLHSILTGLCLCCKPDRIQFLLSDTKGVEFTQFIGAPHLLFEPATSVYQTLEQMDWIIEEVERRLKTFSSSGARNILEYRARGKSLPSLVLVVDELADMLTDRTREGKGPSIGKIAADKLDHIVRRSRASGAYVIAATQRPSVNIVSGTIKANFPARATFRLPSEADSRTIIGEGGAEHLLSFGDMLFSCGAGLRRIHAPFVEETELAMAMEMALRLS